MRHVSFVFLTNVSTPSPVEKTGVLIIFLIQGFAIGSAAFVSVALYGAFVFRLRVKTGVPWRQSKGLPLIRSSWHYQSMIYEA